MKWKVSLTSMLALILAACSPSPEKTGIESNGKGSGETKKPSAGGSGISFDPALRSAELRKAASNPAPGTKKPNSNTDPANVPAKPAVYDITGREAKLAAEFLATPMGELESLALTELIERWAKSDLEAAWNFRHLMGDNVEVQRAFYRGIMPYFAEQDPELVLKTIEAGNWWPGQFESERTAMLKVADYDLEQAVTHFSNTKIGMQTKEVSYLFTSRLAGEQSLETALAFAEGVKKPIARAWAIRAAVGQWVEADSLAASQYVNDLEDPLSRSHAVLGLIDGIWQTNPRDSITWAQTIDDGELRQSTLSKLATTWELRGETENVNAVLNAQGLSNTDRRAVEEALAVAAENAAAAAAAAAKTGS